VEKEIEMNKATYIVGLIIISVSAISFGSDNIVTCPHGLDRF
jgi:fructose-specific phosphotransferase system IIC component